MPAPASVRITVLFNTAGPPPANQDYSRDLESGARQAEYDIHRALLEAGYDSRLLGIYNDIRPLLDGLAAQQPDLVFNTCEAFRKDSAMEMNVAALLDLLGVPYTGSAPAALLLGRDKVLTKKILDFHQVPVPRFYLCARGKPIEGARGLNYPLIVKPVGEDGSRGIAQASVVKDDRALEERATFVHQSLQQDAVVEEFIEGREFYLGVLGNDELQNLPPVEIRLEGLPAGTPRIASYRAKWDPKFRHRHGITSIIRRDLPIELMVRMEEAARTCYRALHLHDYGRIDVRVTPDHRFFVLEANPNPYLAKGDDMADAAEQVGLGYSAFIARIVELALVRGRAATGAPTPAPAPAPPSDAVAAAQAAGG